MHDSLHACADVALFLFPRFQCRHRTICLYHRRYENEGWYQCVFPGCKSIVKRGCENKIQILTQDLAGRRAFLWRIGSSSRRPVDLRLQRNLSSQISKSARVSASLNSTNIYSSEGANKWSIFILLAILTATLPTFSFHVSNAKVTQSETKSGC